MTSSAEAIVRRYLHEVWVLADAAAIEALLSPEYIDHDPPPGVGGTRTDQRRAIELLGVATRDRAIRILTVHACGDFAAVRQDTSWVQVGSLFGLPGDGQRVLLRVCELYRVSKDRIVESWHVESIARG
jgi:hypothetical protein